jgi:transposase-like protein
MLAKDGICPRCGSDDTTMENGTFLRERWKCHECRLEFIQVFRRKLCSQLFWHGASKTLNPDLHYNTCMVRWELPVEREEE